MKNINASIIAAVLMLFCVNANALLVSGQIGANGEFTWFKPDSSSPVVFDVDGDSSNGIDSAWMLSVDYDAFIDVYITDRFVAGDSFNLYLNDSLLTPSIFNYEGSEPGGSSNLYQAWYYDVFLATGVVNIFELELVSQNTTGKGSYSFSSVRAEIPEPSSLLLLILGLVFGLVVLRSRMSSISCVSAGSHHCPA